jgi:hypothetical protein
MKRATLALVAVLALTACAGSAGYANHRFESLAELRDVLAKADYSSCSSWADDKAKTDASLNKYGWDYFVCTDGNVIIWRSDVVRADIQSKNPNKPGMVSIEGINWTVNLPTDRMDQVNKVLKGTVK